MKGLDAFIEAIGRLRCSLAEQLFAYSCFIRGRFIPVSSFRIFSINWSSYFFRTLSLSVR
jgi:hypothetical protein